MRAQKFIVEINRRGFLKGLVGFAASASVPAPLVKLLSTPAGVSSLATSAGVSALGIEAGLALLKGIRKHLDQYTAEDDDDYYEAWEDMSAELGFDATDAEGYYHSPLSDLLTLHRKNPEQAAQQLIKHIQTQAIDPADVKSTFQPRDDWRYHARKNREEPELTGGYGDKPTASAQSSVKNVANVATAPGSLARAATVAKAGIDKLSNLGKNMGLGQQVKSTPALSAPTRPEVELPTNVKQKIKQGKQLTEFNLGESGVGVVASKKQAKDPRYSTSLTRDVRPGQIGKNLRAFKLAESNIDLLAAQLIDHINQDIDAIKQRFATEKLPADYKEMLKNKIEQLKARRHEIMMGR
jgi:hypothetical protein